MVLATAQISRPPQQPNASAEAVPALLSLVENMATGLLQFNAHGLSSQIFATFGHALKFAAEAVQSTAHGRLDEAGIKSALAHANLNDYHRRAAEYAQRAPTLDSMRSALTGSADVMTAISALEPTARIATELISQLIRNPANDSLGVLSAGLERLTKEFAAATEKLAAA